MKIKPLVITTIASAALSLSTLVALAAGARNVTISGFDTMKYSINTIEAHPGEKLTVTLKNDGNMPKEAMGHNWILLKAGEDPQSYANSAVTAKSEDYQPKSLASKVLASIKVLGPKESGSVTFTVPTAPGKYAYLCSFPAHCQVGMKGLLIVK
jgi:azurin